MNGEFTIDDSFFISGKGLVISGKVESGVLKPGMQGEINGNLVIIQSIQMLFGQKEEAQQGDQVGLVLDKGDQDEFKKYSGLRVNFETKNLDY